MQIVFDDGSQRRELDLRVNNPAATVADLADALGDTGERPLLIGDQRADPDLELVDAGLFEGAVVRFGSDSIGLMWSNQVDKKFYFAVHRDADAGNVWQVSEVAHGGGVAGCGTVSNGGTGCANDHLHVRATSDGRVFAAISSATRTRA